MADVTLQSIFDEVRRALDTGETDQAIAIAQHILQHAPDVIEAHRLLGEAYLNAEQFEQAAAAFEDALRADPENIAAYYGLGLADQNLGRRSKAIGAFERALEIQPNLADLRTQLLRLYAETPGSAGQFRLSRAGLGRLYARGQMYAQAIDEFRSVLDNEPDRDDVRVALAETLWRDGQEDEAVDWCHECIASQPELFKPTLILGYLQLAAGQPEGETLWRRAAQQEPALQTARMLFEVLPPVKTEELTVPAFDERAWREAQRQREAVVVTPEQAPVVVAADDDFGDSWLNETSGSLVMPTPLPPPAPPADVSDDDLLASLLGFDDQSGDTAVHDLDGAAPFARDESQAAAPPSLDEIGVDPAEVADDALIDGVEPFTAGNNWPEGEDDDGLGVVEPFSLADLDLEAPDDRPAAEPARASGDLDEASIFAKLLRDRSEDEPAGATLENVATSPDTDDRFFSVDDVDLHGMTVETAATSSSRQPDEHPQAMEDEAKTPTEILQPAADEWPAAQPEGHNAPAGEHSSTSQIVDDSETTPFSLANLGLSDEELERLSLNAEPAAPREVADAAAAGADTPGDDEETTPFSLADLGLSDEELASFGVAETPNAEEPAHSIHTADTMPFDVPAAPSPTPVVEPEPAGVPEPTASAADEAQSPVGAAVGSGPGMPVVSNPTPDDWNRYYQQLGAQPDNHGLRLAIARMSERQGDIEQALALYKQLILHGALLDPVVEDLRELATGDYDRALQRRIHRLLGDVYMAQHRLEEAMREYSWI